MSIATSSDSAPIWFRCQNNKLLEVELSDLARWPMRDILHKDLEQVRETAKTASLAPKALAEAPSIQTAELRDMYGYMIPMDDWTLQDLQTYFKFLKVGEPHLTSCNTASLFRLYLVADRFCDLDIMDTIEKELKHRYRPHGPYVDQLTALYQPIPPALLRLAVSLLESKIDELTEKHLFPGCTKKPFFGLGYDATTDTCWPHAVLHTLPAKIAGPLLPSAVKLLTLAAGHKEPQLSPKVLAFLAYNCSLQQVTAWLNKDELPPLIEKVAQEALLWHLILSLLDEQSPLDGHIVCNRTHPLALRDLEISHLKGALLLTQRRWPALLEQMRHDPTRPEPIRRHLSFVVAHAYILCGKEEEALKIAQGPVLPFCFTSAIWQAWRQDHFSEVEKLLLDFQSACKDSPMRLVRLQCKWNEEYAPTLLPGKAWPSATMTYGKLLVHKRSIIDALYYALAYPQPHRNFFRLLATLVLISDKENLKKERNVYRPPLPPAPIVAGVAYHLLEYGERAKATELLLKAYSPSRHDRSRIYYLLGGLTQVPTIEAQLFLKPFYPQYAPARFLPEQVIEKATEFAARILKSNGEVEAARKLRDWLEPQAPHRVPKPCTLL